jgi:hypothetical protein
MKQSAEFQITQISNFFKAMGILFSPDINISGLCADTCHKFVCEHNAVAAHQNWVGML